MSEHKKSSYYPEFIKTQNKKVLAAIALSIMGVIAFVVIATSLPIRTALFGSFFEKEGSDAATGQSSNVVFVNQSNSPIQDTNAALVNIRLTSPWQASTIEAGTPQVQGTANANLQVKSQADNVNQSGNSLESATSSTWIGTAGNASSSWTGYRFTNASIPKGARIDSAKLMLNSERQQWISIGMNIRGDNSGNSASFGNNSLPSQRSLTSASVNYSTNNRWVSKQWYEIADLKAIVQEIVNRSDWQSGNSLSIIMKGTGGSWGRKFVTSYQGNSASAPKLEITYTTPDGQPNPTSQITPTAPQATATNAPTNTPVPTNRPTTPPTATPVPYTVLVELAENSDFTQNYFRTPYTSSPMVQTYTFSNSNPGRKTVYARFTASNGQTQTFSNWIDLTSPPTNTPTPTLPPTGGQTGQNSHAMGLWNPNPKYDTCPNPSDTARIKEIHDSYKVMGPDGKWYPTWHPPIDPTTGCKFGHEHGRDPRNSELFTFLKEQYGFDADKNGRVEGAELTTSGIPFGYVNEQLDVFNASKGITNGTRHEDHVGHKIEWENNLERDWSTTIGGSQRSPSGIFCDFFMKVHQGTHSKDAFTNNMHELIQGYECTDGTKIANAQMLLFGRPGGFVDSRDGDSFIPVGPPSPPNSPNGGNAPGREIPLIGKVRQYVTVPQGSWSLYSEGIYEDWLSGNYVRLPNGNWIAYYDPHFAVFSPSRFFWPGTDTDSMGITRTAQDKTDNMGRSVDLCYMSENNGAEKARGGQCDLMTNYGQLKEKVAWDDPRSLFNGVKREFYFNNMGVQNTGGNTVWYADPFGNNAQTSPFTGSVRHFLKPKTSSTPHPYPFDSDAIGAERNYGGSGVHAPN